MDRSLIHFRQRGFWAKNTPLCVWLCVLAEEMGHVEPMPEWLRAARDHWLSEAKNREWPAVLREEWGTEGPEDAEGCIVINLNGHLNEEEKVGLLTELSERALSRLEQEGPLLSPEVLNTLGLPGDAMGGVEGPPCADIGRRWLALLAAAPPGDYIRHIHYISEFDGIQIVVSDREVAGHLWDFAAPLALSAIQQAQVRSSWQPPWTIIGGLILLLTGGLFIYMALVLGHGEPAHERVLVTAFGAVFLIPGALRCWHYFTNRKRELVVTTAEGERGVLYMDHHDPTFFAFLEKLKNAFAASEGRELPMGKDRPDGRRP